MPMGVPGAGQQPLAGPGAGSGGAGLMHFPQQYGYAHSMNMYPTAMPPPPPPSVGMPSPMAHGIVVYPTPPPPALVPALAPAPAVEANASGDSKGKKNSQQRRKTNVSEPNKRRKVNSGADAQQRGEMVDPNELSVDVGIEEPAGDLEPQQEEKEAYHSYCEACEKDFASSTAWDAHLAAHDKCSHPGCEFSATKKVLSAHWQLAHGQFSGTGLKDIEVEVEGQKKKFKVLVGTSPEEVEQWREERRKRFPSAANMQAKREDLEKVRSFGGVESSASGGARGKSGVKKSGKQENVDGGAGGAASEGFEEQKERDIDDKTATKDGSESGTGTARGGAQVKTTLCQYFSRGRCKHGEECRYIHDKGAQASYAEERKKRQRMNASELEQLERKQHAKKGKLFLPKPLAGGDRGTLLKRLLQDDISSEENIILQCFRYFTTSNFFEGSSKEDEPSLNE